jgi:hypothetical protein
MIDKFREPKTLLRFSLVVYGEVSLQNETKIKKIHTCAMPEKHLHVFQLQLPRSSWVGYDDGLRRLGRGHNGGTNP